MKNTTQQPLNGNGQVRCLIMVQHVKMSQHHKNVDWAITTNYTNTYLNKLRIEFHYKEVHTIQINITLYGMVS